MFTSCDAADGGKITNSYLLERMWCLFKGLEEKKMLIKLSNLPNKRKESKRVRR